MESFELDICPDCLGSRIVLDCKGCQDMECATLPGTLEGIFFADLACPMKDCPKCYKPIEGNC
jgi:hypothetical protein